MTTGGGFAADRDDAGDDIAAAGRVAEAGEATGRDDTCPVVVVHGGGDDDAYVLHILRQSHHQQRRAAEWARGRSSEADHWSIDVAARVATAVAVAAASVSVAFVVAILVAAVAAADVFDVAD